MIFIPVLFYNLPELTLFYKRTSYCYSWRWIQWKDNAQEIAYESYLKQKRIEKWEQKEAECEVTDLVNEESLWLSACLRSIKSCVYS